MQVAILDIPCNVLPLMTGGDLYCSHCGEKLSDSLEEVSTPDGNVIVSHECIEICGKRLHSKPMQRTLLKKLVQAFGKPVSNLSAYMSMYSARPDCDQPEFEIIKVHICHLRKVIAGTGYRIATIWGFGYRLERDD